MSYSIVFILLPICVLGIMLMRTGLPFRAKIAGKPIGEIKLNFRERLLLQRWNVGALGIILTAAAATGHFPLIPDLTVILAASAMLLIPVRYIVTSKGLTMNNILFRPWEHFTGFEINRRGIRLLPQEGLKPFNLRLADQHVEELIVLLHRCSRYGGPETQILRKGILAFE